MRVTDDERRAAAARAAHLWRSLPEATPKCYHPHHRCEDRRCEVIEIPYAAIARSGAILVTLSRPPPDAPDLIEDLPPIYGCLVSGAVHACGEECDRRGFELTCSITGFAFGEERRDKWWSPYPRENKREWRLNVFSRPLGRSEPVGVREVLANEGFATRFGADLIEDVRHRPRVRGKEEAFDVAFAIASIVLSDERFENALGRLFERGERALEQAKRAATHALQGRRPVNASELMDALPAEIEPEPVLISDPLAVRRQVVRYAEHCIALWHLIYANVDRGMIEMSFRDFCSAAIGLFGKGHNVPSWKTGRDAWVVQRDPILAAFPLNRWAESKIYWDVRDPKKINGLMRRAEKRIKKALDEYVSGRDASVAYLRYASLPYDSVPETAFADVKR